jgi:oxygen-independent coproporphyrinogen-3 oxidase
VSVPRFIPVAVAGDRPAAAAAPHLRSLPPLALYVHVPWCVRKCPYCDFNSHEMRGAASLPEQEYVDALIADLEQALPLVWGRRVVSVFIGGGTPSLLSPKAVDALLAAVRARLPVMAEAEITLEANPGTVEAAKFAGFRAAGVNRISLGVQSFDPAHLRALGRIHDEREAHAAVEIALRHFDNVNLDLMYALPGQDLADARRDIEIAADYAPAHLSAYHLTVEPNTLFHRQPPALPDPDLAADMQDMIEASLAQHGYQHYETSAFAKPGRRCGHNLNYWQFGDYIGIGAGAHGKLSFPDRIVREVRHKRPESYLDQVGRGTAVRERREVALAELPFEFMMNGVRLIDGVPTSLFAQRTGLALEAIRRELGEAERRGLLEVTPERIAPTLRGRRFLNNLLQLFLPER